MNVLERHHNEIDYSRESIAIGLTNTATDAAVVALADEVERLDKQTPRWTTLWDKDKPLLGNKNVLGLWFPDMMVVTHYNPPHWWDSNGNICEAPLAWIEIPRPDLTRDAERERRQFRCVISEDDSGTGWRGRYECKEEGQMNDDAVTKWADCFARVREGAYRCGAGYPYPGMTEIADGVERLEDENAALREQLRWRPVSVPPKRTQPVLMWFGDTTVEAGMYWYGSLSWQVHDKQALPLAWLPIPPRDPPQKEKVPDPTNEALAKQIVELLAAFERAEMALEKALGECRQHKG